MATGAEVSWPAPKASVSPSRKGGALMADPRSAVVIQPITRMTIPMLSVLAVLVDGDGWYGLRIAQAAGMRTGTVYPILARFERAGWVSSTWEDKEDPEEKNDPGARRKYFHLTSEGRDNALAALRLREKALAGPRPVLARPQSALGR